jgi:inositol transport system permease protein
MNINIKTLSERFRKNGIFFVLLVIFLFCSIFVNGFFSSANLTNVLRQITVVTILALGATFVIILGHINVAYGSEIALIGCFACTVMVATGSLFLAVLAAVFLGLLIGTINGFVITTFNIPAFIMTLAVTTVTRGAVLLYTNATPITGMAKEFVNTYWQQIMKGVIILFAVITDVINKRAALRRL